MPHPRPHRRRGPRPSRTRAPRGPRPEKLTRASWYVRSMSVKFGAFVPQGWKLELSGMKAAEAWETSKAVARQAEALGYDHLWVYDHVETVPRREPTHVFEAWTVMAVLAEITSAPRLGQLVTCAS